MAKGQKKEGVLMRTEKWELKLDTEQEKLLVRVSDSLREIYNWGLEQWMGAYREWREQKKAGVEKPNIRFPTFFDEVNQLTAMKKVDEAAGLFRARVPRNWKEETLDALHGGLSSFFSLVKKGDRDARPPKPRNELRFSAIPGRSGFSIKGVARDKYLVLAPNIFKEEEELTFPIPGEYQALMLARASRELKFIISRDEPWLSKPGRYWISLSYEIPKPEQKPFVPEEAVYIALGASSIGVVSPRGEEVIPLWRSDKHWKPEIDTVEAILKGKRRSEVAAIASGKPRANRRSALTKGSKTWRRLQKSRGEMFRIMGAQQTQDRREVVAIDLIEKVAGNLIYGHGVHFVVSELVVRSKEGKLADASKEERGGPLGLNWSAQNTGSIGYLARWLEEKAPEYGGTVRKHKLPYEALPDELPEGHENKIPMARALRDDFLKSYETAA